MVWGFLAKVGIAAAKGALSSVVSTVNPTMKGNFLIYDSKDAFTVNDDSENSYLVRLEQLRIIEDCLSNLIRIYQEIIDVFESEEFQKTKCEIFKKNDVEEIKKFLYESRFNKLIIQLGNKKLLRIKMIFNLNTNHYIHLNDGAEILRKMGEKSRKIIFEDFSIAYACFQTLQGSKYFSPSMKYYLTDKERTTMNNALGVVKSSLKFFYEYSPGNFGFEKDCSAFKTKGKDDSNILSEEDKIYLEDLFGVEKTKEAVYRDIEYLLIKSNAYELSKIQDVSKQISEIV